MCGHPPKPRPRGIYTYRIRAVHDEEGGCDDQDKSRWLEISDVSVSDFQWLDLPTKAQVTLGYRLDRGAANCEVRVFNHDLEEVAVTSPADGALSNVAGTYSVTVEFEDPDQIVGSYRFVISATETAADGNLNRDRQAKPALQKGATIAHWPPAQTCAGPGSLYFDLGRINTQPHQRNLIGDPDYVGQYNVGTCADNPSSIQDTVEHASIFTYYGHGDNTFLDLGAQVYNLSELQQTDLSHMLLAVWMHCHSAAPNSGHTFPEVSVAQGADCSIGWTNDVRASCIPYFCDDFWSLTCRLDHPVEGALEDAVWETWVILGSWLTEGLFDYVCEGDGTIQLTPARYGH